MKTLIQRIGLSSNGVDELLAVLNDLAKTYANLHYRVADSKTLANCIHVIETKLTDGSTVYDAIIF